MPCSSSASVALGARLFATFERHRSIGSARLALRNSWSTPPTIHALRAGICSQAHAATISLQTPATLCPSVQTGARAGHPRTTKLAGNQARSSAGNADRARVLRRRADQSSEASGTVFTRLPVCAGGRTE